MCTHTFMTTKTITIMNDAYKILLRNKHRDESFSDVIRRTLTKKRNIMEFAGVLKLSEEDAKEIKDSILKLRKKSTLALK